MNINQMLNNVLAQSGFLERATFFNSNDPDDKQMVAISNRVQQEIRDFFKWTGLRMTYKVNLPAPVNRVSTLVLPPSYKSLVADSMWESEGSRAVEIPTSDSDWYQYKFSSLTDGGTLRAKIYGDKIEFIGAAEDLSTEISFEYISKYAVKSAQGELKELFDNDNDTFLLDDQLLILGIQAHWQQTKMMPTYQEHFMNYYRKMNESIGRSSGGKTIGGRSAKQYRSPYTNLWVN